MSSNKDLSSDFQKLSVGPKSPVSGLSADIQARVLAFQEKRQLKSSQDKPLPPLPSKPSRKPPPVPEEDHKPLKIRPTSGIPSQAASARLPRSRPSLSQRRGMKLDVKGLTEEPEKNSSVSNMLEKKGQLPNQQPQHQPKLQGNFASYAEFVDVKSGSLNFSGKASLHSKGIDFTSGSSFRISLDELTFLEELGRGNYGTVSKVLHNPTGIVMAMKEVRLELDDSKFAQILMELEVLHKCNSECIVDFYGAFFVEGAVYMCIEYMNGGSLDKVYGEGLPEPQLAYVTKCVVKGLRELKDEHNIIHRDVKPTNILVNDQGKVKLCDFGVSGNLVASMARTNIGCQSYMAPERIKSANPDDISYTVQSDVWSLGLSILEISKGSYPYPPETYDNIFSQLTAIVDGEPPKLASWFSSTAQDFVSQCLHKIPEERPSYQEMLQHPWLKMFKDSDAEDLMKDFVVKHMKASNA